MNGYTEKAIKSICRHKIDDLCKYISKDDKELAEDLRKHCFVSGGAITSLLQGEQPNDFDIYIDNLDVLYKICVYYTNQWNNNHKRQKSFTILKHNDEYNNRVEIQVTSSGIVNDNDVDTQDEDYNIDEQDDNIDDIIDDKIKYRVRCITSNAISLSDDIQIICRFCGNPEQIFKNYDFIHTMQAYTRMDDNLILNTNSLVSIMCKRLQYQGSLFPICSLFRMRKFIKRGWTISSIEIFKIAYQISKLDLSNIDVLREQLIGCDYFYMMSFCKELNEWQLKNKEEEISYEYMFELIEKVFDKDYTIKDEK